MSYSSILIKRNENLKIFASSFLKALVYFLAKGISILVTVLNALLPHNIIKHCQFKIAIKFCLISLRLF
jgi:hypothetical protein